ncbi:MAG: cytochrome c biogenesis protein CcsA [Dysgonamonadaceae bacterium]|jgi:ABC-type transport system involved in cytochrome c biogenesis permease subunit|nr:cytochrome c biogenesis protein CcsA [Dysgonamonadaceae bacterium]
MKQKYTKQIAFGTWMLLIVVLSAATVLEKLFGSARISTHLYGSYPFVFLWLVCVTSSVIYIFQRKLYRNKAAFLLHCSFVCILAGAAITFLSGDRGYISIRQGETSNYYISDNDGERHFLPFSLKLLRFDIEYHPGTNQPADFKSFVQTENEIHQISMNKILKQKGYRIYQHSYDSDETGTTLFISHDPWGTNVTYAGYLLLGASLLILLWLRIGRKGFLFLAVPTACVWFYLSQLNPTTPVLRSPMLAAHVSVIMIAYTLFLFIFISGITALCSPKRREKLYRCNSVLLYPAVFLLIAGIFIGAVWANISWGCYWRWDAKETWALITMLVYAVPLHKKSIRMLNNPVKFHYYCVFAFLSIVITFFGVTYILGGIHSYV